MMKKKSYLLLGVVVLVAGLLRFWNLGINPPSLTWDEAAWGYNAYSLGLTGKDEFGRFWPLDYLESFGDFKPPLYAYLTILPVKIFGLNEFAVRFPSAFLGTFTVLLTYFLVKELFGNHTRQFLHLGGAPSGHHPRCLEFLPLVASLLLAVSPWHIMLSRAAFEANVASFFLVGGALFFLMGLQKKIWFLPFSAIFFALSFYTFNTPRIVVPLLVLMLVVSFPKKLWQERRWALTAGLVGLVILLPAIPFFLSPQARLRFKEVNIFSDSSVVMVANEAMANDNWAWWSRIIHNRRWGYAREFLRHYFDHFNPRFLFIKGDGNPKFSTQDVGELYLWELPFLVTGILFLLRKRPGFWWLVPFWLLVGIIPAATARETPHALRIETTLPTWQILTAYGVISFMEFLRTIEIKKTFKFLICVFTFSFFIFNFIYFQHGYWRHYPVEFSGEWQYGYKESIAFIKQKEGQYDEIWFTDQLGRPYIYFLFYLQKDPQEFWREAEVEREALGFVKVKKFGEYHFFRAEATPSTSGRVLVIDVPSQVPQNVEVIKTFYLLNGQERLKAYEVGGF